MAIWMRNDRLDGLIHHTDRGSQYTSIRYTERLAETGAVASVGSRGDSYDNALAESTIGLYKTELIRRLGPWRNLDHVELATLEWIDWWNHRRLHGEIGMVPPAELEDAHYHQDTLTRGGHSLNDASTEPSAVQGRKCPQRPPRRTLCTCRAVSAHSDSRAHPPRSVCRGEVLIIDRDGDTQRPDSAG
jgi:hypothetical protein